MYRMGRIDETLPQRKRGALPRNTVAAPLANNTRTPKAFRGNACLDRINRMSRIARSGRRSATLPALPNRVNALWQVALPPSAANCPMQNALGQFHSVVKIINTMSYANTGQGEPKKIPSRWGDRSLRKHPAKHYEYMAFPPKAFGGNAFERITRIRRMIRTET